MYTLTDINGKILHKIIDDRETAVETWFAWNKVWPGRFKLYYLREVHLAEEA